MPLVCVRASLRKSRINNPEEEEWEQKASVAQWAANNQPEAGMDSEIERKKEGGRGR